MSMEKVAWDYIDGVPAMNNLVKMLETCNILARCPKSHLSDQRDGVGAVSISILTSSVV